MVVAEQGNEACVVEAAGDNAVAVRVLQLSVGAGGRRGAAAHHIIHGPA